MTLLTRAEEYRAAAQGAGAIKGKGWRGVGVPGDQARFLCVSVCRSRRGERR
jgi:hypothetical protein